MREFAYVRACMFVAVLVRMCVCVYLHGCMRRPYVNVVSAWLRACECVSMFVRMYACVHAHARLCSCDCVRMHVC